MMNTYITAMRRGFDFSGRSTRSEFWLFTLVSALLFGTAAQLLDLLAGSYHRFFFLVFFIHLIPSLAVSARRLHDTNRAGGWYFLVFTVIGVIPLIVFYCQRGTPGPNRYGEPVSRDVRLTSSPSNFAPSASLPRDSDATAELERLAALRGSGALTEVEFTTLKAQVLARMSAG